MDVVNAAWVDERLDAIQASIHDPEVAHSIEDSLRVAVLQAIAEGAEEPARLAAKALESKAIEFERHCA
ncbi:hypothetical protein [Nocardia sp. NPDC057440]|uniref:hypothetical protein n=1 Tax=Nocardia sp. NPDC057440 TaxID=3346134 RepID=UPI00366D742A